MNITQKQIDRFIFLTSHASYNEELKREFKNLGRRILKYIAEQIGLAPAQYDIRWNPGGIACSGDHTLHTDRFYLALHDNLGMGWFYWRTVTGRRDYTGGPNQIVSWDHLKQYGLGSLIDTLRHVQNSSGF